MDRVKQLAGKGWTWFRGLPWWGQALGGLFVVSVVVGPFLDEGASDEKASDTTVSVISETTSSAVVPEPQESAPQETVPSETAAATSSTTTTSPATTIAATTSTVSEQDRVAGKVADGLNGGELLAVDLPDALITPDQITITVAGSEGLTEGLTTDAARLAVSSTLRGLLDAELPPTVTRFRVIVTYDLQNELGEVTNRPVVDVVYDRAIVERIQFDNISFKSILTIPTVNLYVHPAFAKDDGS